MELVNWAIALERLRQKRTAVNWTLLRLIGDLVEGITSLIRPIVKNVQHGRIFNTRVKTRLALVFIAAFRLAGAEDGYLESGACAGCHPQVAASYARTGMARSLGQVITAITVPTGTFRHDSSEQLFTVSRRGGKPFLKRQQTGPDGSPA